MSKHGLGHSRQTRNDPDPDPDQTIDDNEDYYLAPHTQRAFGAGLKRKRVEFVPASTEDSAVPTTMTPSKPSAAAGARYLSIVLKQQQQSQPQSSAAVPTTQEEQDITSESKRIQSTRKTETEAEICPICHEIRTPQHETSIAHQLSLAHSHPPSHLDRTRKGLKYLETYGWDPDSRTGLGARGEGIRVPVKAREKRDTAGLGLFAEDQEERDKVKVKGKRKEVVEEPVLVNAKEVRRLEERKKKKAEKLRSVFYGEDLSRYLGPGE